MSTLVHSPGAANTGYGYAVEILRDVSSLHSIGDDWRRLLQVSGGADVFQSFEWAVAWMNAHVHDWVPYTPVVRDSVGRTIGILPLARSGDRLAFIGNPYSDYNNMLASEELVDTLLPLTLDALLDDDQGWTECYLENISERSPLCSVLIGLQPKYASRIIRGDASACPSLVAAGDNGVWTKAARKDSLRRHRKKLETAGRLSFRHIEDANEIERHLPTFVAQHAARRGMAGERSLFHEPAAVDFYKNMIRCMNPQRELRFSVLTLADEPIAYHLGFEMNGKYVWYKPTFDVDLWDYSPGEVLLQHILLYCQERQLTELDFTIGNEGFKNRFANQVRLNYSFRLFRSSFRASQARMQVQAKRHLLRMSYLVWSVRKIRRAGGAVVRDGVQTTLRRIARVAVRTVAQFDDVIVFRWPRGGPNATHRSDLEMRPLSMAVVAQAAPDYGQTLSPEVLREFLRRIRVGDRGFMVIRKGRLAHIAWVGDREEIVAETETGPQCRYKPRERAVLIYDCWTPREHRGAGIYAWVLRTLCGIAEAEGKEAWIFCHAANKASEAGIRKAGFVPHCRFHRRVSRLGSKQWVSETTPETQCDAAHGATTMDAGGNN